MPNVSRTRKTKTFGRRHPGCCRFRFWVEQLAASSCHANACGFRRSGAFERFGLGRGEERRSGVLRPSGSFGQVGPLIAAVCCSRTAARHGVGRSSSGLISHDIGGVGRSCSSDRLSESAPLLGVARTLLRWRAFRDAMSDLTNRLTGVCSRRPARIISLRSLAVARRPRLKRMTLDALRTREAHVHPVTFPR